MTNSSSVSVRRLRIYSERSFVSAKRGNHCVMMMPFWGPGERPPWCGDPAVFDRYVANGRSYFELVDQIEQADLAILPSTLHAYLSDGTESQAKAFADKAARAGKRLVVFHERDFDFRPPFENAVLFSPTIDGGRGFHEFGLPAWCDDPLGGAAALRKKNGRPVVSFCGWVRRPTAIGHAKRLVRMYVPYVNKKRMGTLAASVKNNYKYYYIRSSLIPKMERSSKITVDFILRPNFYAGSKKKKTEEERAISSAIARAEFIQNLINSDYALCVRGVGNYSVRFYEALALGRLPLFVDTNCVLPYDFAVDWRSEMPWIGYRDRSGIVEILVNFHDSLSEEDFQKRQRRARTLWDGWLSPDGFFRNFHMHFGPGRVPL